MIISIVAFSPTAPHTAVIDLNAFGSNYASQYGHNVNHHIQRQVEYMIYDAAPKGYFTDLKLMMDKPRQTWNSDEKSYYETTFGRKAVVATANVAAGVTQVLTVSSTSTESVTENCLVVYPNNQKGNVVNVNPTLSQITVRAMTGQTLPAVTANDTLSFQSTVMADGENKIYMYSRAETIERYNYIQMFARGDRFGSMELWKYKMSGNTNYLDIRKQSVMNQFRVDMSNCFWNGERGEVTLSNGNKAKTMGGFFPIMAAAGAPNTTTTLATLPAAIEDMALSSQYEGVGYTRFLAATPRRIMDISNAYKRPAAGNLIRWDGGGRDTLAKLDLTAIDMGSHKLVLLPVQRWDDISCFPSIWKDRIILADFSNVELAQTWGETITDQTPDFRSGYNQNKFSDFIVEGQLSMQMPNPQGNAWIDIQ